MGTRTSFYGITAAAIPAARYHLSNDTGMEVELTNYGATVLSIKVPDRTGKVGEVTLGYDKLGEWEKGRSFFGAIVGRFGNRIAQGRFTLDGHAYHIPTNDGPNMLHGGETGFHQRLWTVGTVDDDGTGRSSVKLTYVSPDGEQGFPGTLTSEVTYSLGSENELVIDYRLTADAPTVANLTSHIYFNLAGDDHGSVLDHEIRIDADRYTITDETMIPTGELPEVEGTPMDFRSPQRIGARIDDDFQPLAHGGGYDHTYVLNGEGLREVAEVSDPASGRVMTVLTTEPGVQFYSGNSLKDEPGRNGLIYPRRGAFCLETQHLPDSPNHPNFPSTVLRPGEVYTSRTIYRFSTR